MTNQGSHFYQALDNSTRNATPNRQETQLCCKPPPPAINMPRDNPK